MLCAKFNWNWLSSSREDVRISSISFAMTLSSLLGKKRGLLFNETWILFTQCCFVLSLIKIGPVVLEKKVFKFPQSIFAISLWPFYAQTDIFFTQGCFVLRLAEIGPAVLEKRRQWEEFTTTMAMTKRTTDNGQISIRKVTCAFDSDELTRIFHNTIS